MCLCRYRRHPLGERRSDSAGDEYLNRTRRQAGKVVLLRDEAQGQFVAHVPQAHRRIYFGKFAAHIPQFRQIEGDKIR